MRSLHLVSALLLFTVFGTAARAEPESNTVREGKHFRIVLHWEAPAIADSVLRTAEAMWAPAAKLYGLSQGKLDKLLELNVYRNSQAYEAAEALLTKGRFKRNLAFFHWSTQTSHVAVQPTVSDDVLRAFGVPYLTHNLVLHEAAHLIRAHAMPNFRSHPDWFADGAAQWLKYRALLALKMIDDLESDPTSATAIDRAQRAKGVTARRILDNDIGDLHWHGVYATKRMLFTHLMRTHGKAMRGLVQTLRGMPAGRDFGARARKVLADALGEHAMAGLDKAYAKFLGKLEPQWTETHRSLGPVKGGWLQTTFNSNALAWRTEPVKRQRYALSVRMRILRNYDGQANLLIDKREGGFVSVAFRPGFGVNVFTYDAKRNAWRNRVSKELATLVQDKPHDVRVVVDGTDLQVHLDGTRVCDVALPERKGGLTGPWGLGAQSGSAVRWSRVTVK